jgi:undecaprenyl-diphosphatase
MNKIKNISKWIVCGIGILIFATMVVMLLTNNVTSLDNSIYNIIISSKSDVMTMFMTVITMMCNTEFIIVATLLLVLLIKNKKMGGMIASNVVLCSVINTIIKHIFLRPRPVGIKLIEQGGYSFPSGHSMMAVAFYGLLIYIIWNTKWKNVWKIFTTTLLVILILLIGISRIYVGVHFASDVIAGLSISLSYLIIFIELIYKRVIKKS